MENEQYKSIEQITIGIALSFFLFVTVLCFFLFYPFKTVVFNQPMKIANPSKMVPLLGTVVVNIHYKKYIDNPGLTVRTLVRRGKSDLLPLDSSTVISLRKAGEEDTKAFFTLTNNKFLVGKDTSIVFTIYHTLFGFRPMMVQFETEPFEIYDPATEVKK